MSEKGFLLFMFSSLTFRFITSIFTQRAYTKRILSEDYQSFLRKVFSVSANSNRHSAFEKFERRKTFFEKEFQSSGIDPNVKIIHVAGTKGKGSTVEYIASAIRNSYRVGVFTSPHLHTARERIKLNRNLISRFDFLQIGSAVWGDMQDKEWAVFFDYLLTMAIRYFGKMKVEYIVLETGIGGRFDSTNFVDKPSAVVITSISLDHQALLGDTVEEIAMQKAGIIKAGSNVFTPSSQLESVLKVISDQCQIVGAKLHIVPIERCIHSETSKLEFDVQYENYCLSAAVLNSLGISLQGMDSFHWPCRMEKFCLKQGTMVIDGSHNVDSIRKFLVGMRHLFPGRRVLVVFGAGQDKSVDGMITEVMLNADDVMFVQSSHFRSLPESRLCELASKVATDERKAVIFNHLDYFSSSSSEDNNAPDCKTVDYRLRSLLTFLSNSSNNRVIAVCGSLFVAAQAREALYRLDPRLFESSDWVCERDDE